MIKKVFLYIVFMVSLVACSDDIFNAPTETLPADGRLTISFNVPEMTEPQTRAEEDLISTVQILIFKDGILKQIPDAIDNPDDGERVTLTIDEELRRSDLYFLFVANSDTESFSKGMSLTDVRKKLVGDIMDKDNGLLFMSGVATLQSLLALEPVDMFRNAAKMTVKEKNDGKAYPFVVYGGATQSPVMAGASNGDNSFPATGSPTGVNLNNLKN